MSYRGRHTAAAARRSRQSAQRHGCGRAFGAIGLSVGVGMMLMSVAPAVSPPVTAFTPAPLRDRPGDVSGDLPQAAPRGSPQELQLADPRRLMIPKIAVEAEIQPLALKADGALEVPEDVATSGWYVDGPEPGEPGPAVIVGHLDSRRGPGVFHRLDRVTTGDHVVVEATDGTRSTFAVERIERHPKARFPTAAVYGDTGAATLRLITCGGEFDRTTRSYQDNVIVFARLTSVSPSTQTRGADPVV